MLFSSSLRSFAYKASFIIVIAGPLAACGATQDLGPDGSASVDCKTPCEAKATSCGEPASGVTASCASFCSQSPSSTQISCIQSTACDVLANDFAQEHVVCGVPLLEEASAPAMLDCSTFCDMKAASCGDPDAGNCPALCAKSPTNSQIECIQSSSCSALATAFEAKGTVCGIGSDGG